MHDVLQEIDTIVQELHPAALQTYGLAIAAREYAYDWAARNNIEIDVLIEAMPDLPIDIEQSVYRIIQEGLANISRHSRASKAWVSLRSIPRKSDGSARSRPDGLLVEIRDNGIGFELEKIHAGLGLCSMEERAKKIHGLFAVKSVPGEGTRIQLSLPIEILAGEQNGG